MKIAVAEAKAQFAELIRRVEAGEAIELTRYGRPVARLEPAVPVEHGSLIGALKGSLAVDDPWAGDADIEAMFLETKPS